MRLKPAEYRDIMTLSGVMRTHWFAPVGTTPRPAVMLYSEIYQMTGPIARTAALIAGQGYIVAVPEVYHEYAEPGEAFAYDTAGTERGNRLKITKPLCQYDSDARGLVEYLCSSSECNGRIASVGICLGGHLAFRAAMNREVKAGICLYATDIHKRSLGEGMKDDTLDRMGYIKGEMMMIWGRQDPHIPDEGRKLIYSAMSQAGVSFTWHEFNGEHAFMRDEGHRYDPSLAHVVYTLIFHHLHSHLES
jgi:carboxymethylenebutenolidase